ncbi:hypothetical protein [Oceanobacillus kimchii]|uniref:hypothetical protein n=1 Tax=Oceanobacillus kimchii TaxID=746691 RepID=UPI0011154B46|nr:hypothetical protein [Oceanobacillus kimchii]
MVGTAEDVADYLQEWFEAGAADSFVIVADQLSDALSDFVNQIIPVLQERGLRPENYMGNTLRGNIRLKIVDSYRTFDSLLSIYF